LDKNVQITSLKTLEDMAFGYLASHNLFEQIYFYLNIWLWHLANHKGKNGYLAMWFAICHFVAIW
jgi:hypothetical protein